MSRHVGHSSRGAAGLDSRKADICLESVKADVVVSGMKCYPIIFSSYPNYTLRLDIRFIP